ncbi:MAG: HD domain-containing protein [Bacteroidales bacterium]|nr:HD domain-containing protein [Bacteroidales bacterium]
MGTTHSYSFGYLLRHFQSTANKKHTKGIEKALEWYFTFNSTASPEIPNKESEISYIMAIEMALGQTSICAFIVHDLYSKEKIDIESIEKYCGKDVALIVKDLENVSTLNLNKISIESENFKKLFLSLVSDIRTVFIRMAIMLYLIRHYESTDSNTQKQILRRVGQVFIPFAHRLGLYRIKTEFEDKVMRYSYPEIYTSIEKKVTDSRAKQQAFINGFLAPVRKQLHAEKLRFDIKWRFKSIPSIWTKMKKQEVEFEGVYDLFAIRIILDTSGDQEKPDCWKVYSIVSNLYPPEPARLRDWLTSPKPSGYESLHTTVKDKSGRIVEVQIRTKRMDEIAEKGDAAHWKYKEAKEISTADQWLKTIRETLESPSSGRESNFSGEKFNSDEIFVLTPKGDVRQLPRNATVLDFAFDIHTNIGATCHGAKINGKAANIRQSLKNGDVVEILTSKNQVPKLDWLNFVVTNKARNRIRKTLNEDQVRMAEVGREALLRRCRNWKIQLDDDGINYLMKNYQCKTALDLYAGIASEKFDWPGIKKIIIESKEAQKTPYQKVNIPAKNTGKENEIGNLLTIEDYGSDISYTLAKCCTPIIGDEIFGFVTINRGITIHRINCPNANDMLAKHAYRALKASWNDEAGNQPSLATLHISGDDRIGILNEITSIITSDIKSNIQSISLDAKNKILSGRIMIQVTSNLHVQEVIHKLLKIEGIAKVRRILD